MKHELTQAWVQHLFIYFPGSGMLRYRIDTPSNCAGKIAGHLTSGARGGYRVIKIDGVAYKASHVIWLYKTGKLPSVSVDHSNLLRGDDRWDNLREATLSQNCANRRQRLSRTGYRGVKNNDNKYMARIMKEGRSYYLGNFATPEEASRAYDAAALQYFGEFARLNFPEEANGLDKAVGKKSARA